MRLGVLLNALCQVGPGLQQAVVQEHDGPVNPGGFQSADGITQDGVLGVE